MTLRLDGSDVEPHAIYAVEGYVIRDLLKLAAELSSGVVMNADRRREAGQQMQVRLTHALKIED